MKGFYGLIFLSLFLLSSFTMRGQDSTFYIRLAEIELHPGQVSDYLQILQEETSSSVRLEPGVISIFPMVMKSDSTQIRILEIYRNKQAYAEHLLTPHFLHYKNSTLQMVKSLNLVDMEAVDPGTMNTIFRKMKPDLRRIN